MARSLAVALLLLGALLLVAACYAWPAAAAAVEVLRTADLSAAGPSPRRVVLLARGLIIALASAALATALGAALAGGLAAPRGTRLRGFTTWVCVTVLLVPPYIYAYAWSLPLGVMGAGTAASAPLGFGVTWLRAIVSLATWAAPVAGFLLAAGWSAAGRPAYRLALLDARPTPAVLRAALRPMTPWLVAALLATGALTLTEFSVPHLCLVQTWNTEILAETQLHARPGAALLLAWPLILLTALLLAPLWFMRRRLAALFASEPEDGGGERAWVRAALPGAAMVVLALPLALFVGRLERADALLTAWRSFPSEWPAGLLCAVLAATFAAWMALAADLLASLCNRGAAGAFRRQPWAALSRTAAAALLAVSIIAALVPPVLVGDAFAAGYAACGPVRDTPLIVAFCGAARFGAIAIVAARLAGAAGGAGSLAQAAVDGADARQAWLRVRLPQIAPQALAAGLLVGVLALGEISAAQMVAPPGVGSLSRTLLNAIHFGRNDEVIAMCLYLMAFAGVAAAAGGAALRARGRRVP